MSIRIDNARIIDGSGAASFAGSIFIDDDIIITVGAPAPEAQEIIDAKGQVVCPGFIDTHSHSDLKIMERPFIWPKLRQGITTEVLGQDGIAMAPLPKQYIPAWRQVITGLAGESTTLDWNYGTTEGYLARIEENGCGTNICTLVPHGNIRMEAMGLSNRPASQADIDAMCAILRRDLKAGGFGLSTGLIYPPCSYAETKELIALCTVASEYGRPLVIHQRSEADSIIHSMTEVINIARETGIHVHFSHFKVCGASNADKFHPACKLLDEANAEGLHISLDQYPYIAGSTMLSAILPPWVHAGGPDNLLLQLTDEAARKQILHDIEHGIPGWDNFVAFAGLQGISISSVRSEKNAHVVGSTLIELGKIRDKHPLEAAFDLLVEEAGGVGMIDFYGDEAHVRAIMSRQETNICTDGLLGGTPHPRTYGAFPRVLGRYVREENVMALELAIHKMTAKPAQTFGIERRGQLRSGWYADLVIFDPETVCDTATYAEPRQHPTGIQLVMVNGVVAYDEENGRGGLPTGHVLRLK